MFYLRISILALVLLILHPGGGHAEPATVFHLLETGAIEVAAQSTNGFRFAEFLVHNKSTTDKQVRFPYGVVLISADDKIQNLAILHEKEIAVAPGETTAVTIRSACMNPDRRSPPNGHDQWSIAQDKGMGELIRFFWQGQQFFKGVVAPEFLSTEDKQHQFIQAVIWVYFDASQEKMISFATKYIFKDRAKAEQVIKSTYPAAKSLIDIYKLTHQRAP